MNLKKIGVFFATLMALLCVSLITVTAYAQSVDQLEFIIWEVATDEYGNTFLKNSTNSEEIWQVKELDEHGNLVDVDLAVHAAFLNGVQRNAMAMQRSGITLPYAPISPIDINVTSFEVEIEPQVLGATFYTFRQRHSYIGLGNAVAVSSRFVGPAEISVSQSLTITNTFSASVSVTAQIRESIEAGATFGWERSVETGFTQTGTWNVPSGRTGEIRFTPRLNVSVGDLTRNFVSPFPPHPITQTQLGEAWGASPRRLASGLADGTFELVLVR